MISDFERKMIAFVAVSMVFILLFLFVLGAFSSHQRQTCRLEAMKANRTAEDIVKICP